MKQTDLLTHWNLSFGTPPISGDKSWSRKNVHIIIVVSTSIEEKVLVVFTDEGLIRVVTLTVA